jgi:hypothetical protein
LPGSFSVNRIELKKMLTSLGVSDAAVEGVITTLNKMHRHVNVVFFVDMLEKIGLKQYDINNILRRIGIDDASIAEIFNVLDEERIQSTFGKIVKLEVE